MPTIERSLIRRAAAAACLTLFLTSPALAQRPVAAPTKPEFVPRYDFHLSAAALAQADERFSWDVYFGGDIDVVDYVVGRVGAIIDYEAVLGSQLRAFDPNQGNYTLEVSTSYRIGKTEVAGMFHHVSRHLSDRPKLFPIAWNILGVRALRQVTLRGTTIDVVGDIGGVTEHAHVDYRWSGNVDASVRRKVAPRADIFAHGAGHLMGVEQSRLARGTQGGGLFEVGVRVYGEAGAAELFGGFERRFDADPLDFTPRQWAMLGFRLTRR